MAGDWIKVEIATPDKPEVFEIAQSLNIDPEAVFTKLFRVWSWFDQHSENGNAPLTLRALLDSRAGVPGFADAMEKVGWLRVDGNVLSLPNFDRHVGKSAKKRALTARRVAAHKKQVTPEVTLTALPNALPNALPRVREEEERSTSSVETLYQEPIAEEETTHARAREPAAAIDYANWQPDATILARIRMSDPDVTDAFIETERLEFVTFAEDNHIRENLLRTKFSSQVRRHWRESLRREGNRGPLRQAASDIRNVPVGGLEAWSRARDGPRPNPGESAEDYRSRITTTLTQRERSEHTTPAIDRLVAATAV